MNKAAPLKYRIILPVRFTAMAVTIKKNTQ
jgi:hypothetical protein